MGDCHFNSAYKHSVDNEYNTRNSFRLNEWIFVGFKSNIPTFAIAMPIYTYVTIEPDGSEGEVFEVEQSIKSPTLTKHPENGKPVKRVYESPNINDQYTPGKEKSLSDITRIKKAGFEVLKKDKISGGYYKL